MGFSLIANSSVAYAYRYEIETPFFRLMTDDRAMAVGVVSILLAVFIWMELDKYLLERRKKTKKGR